MIYDIIGDIHGQADKLKGLLVQLGYVDNGEYFVPPCNHKAVFIGDLIDRASKKFKPLKSCLPCSITGQRMPSWATMSTMPWHLPR